MNNPFEYTPHDSCREAFLRLCARLEALKNSPLADDVNLCRELAEGKMLGVLIAEDACGEPHTLYAFSGQLGSRGFHHRGFVEPVFDYLLPDGYFKRGEAAISRMNAEIVRFEAEELSPLLNDYNLAKQRLDARVADFKQECRLSKQQRDFRRRSGTADEGELAEMIRRSQFEKAELRRLKQRCAAELLPVASALERAQERLKAHKERRRADSEALQQWLFTHFTLLNARGERKSLSEIFAETSLLIPPSGAGECCAPKLLQAAYMQGLKPVAMAEYWYGKPKGGEIRRHGLHYPACRGKCLPVLSWMLQGLEIDPPLDRTAQRAAAQEPKIIYENEWFCVVSKPSGILSVPGKGSALSLQAWLTDKYGEQRDAKPAHRLDQDTSGLLIATFGQRALKTMQALFATRRVTKTYVAELCGDYRTLPHPQRGRISLPHLPDVLDRPRQRVDFERGKEAVTDYEFVSFARGRSRVIFHPLTGRTHQLRVHAASEQGLGLPIAGDRLYGLPSGSAERLHLHAEKIEFTFPLDGRHYLFELPAEF